MSSRAIIPEYQPLDDTASGDITRQGFRVTSGLIFWYMSPSKPCEICIISPSRAVNNYYIILNVL